MRARSASGGAGSVRSRLLTAVAWSAGVGLLLLTLYGWLWPARWEDDSRWFTAAAYGAFVVRTLWFHMAVGAGVLALGCVLVKRRRAAVLALPAVVLGFGRPVVNLVPESGAGAGGTRVTVMTANLLYKHPDLTQILPQIEERAPDIICFQEYEMGSDEVLRHALGDRYPYRALAIRQGSFGQAIYSKFPFAEEPDPHPFGLPPDNARSEGIINLFDAQLRVVVDIEGTPVTVQCVHLVSPGRLQYFREQRIQVRLFREGLRHLDGPLILAGDFNSVPHSQTAGAFREWGFSDAFAAAGSGLGFTWPAITALRHLPGFRIDRVLYRGGIRCERAWVGPEHGSDHRPVYAELVIPAP